MKRIVKKIVLLSVAILCCGAVVLGGAWCSAQRDSSPCTEVHIVVQDSMERQWVDANELENYLRRHHVYPSGLTMEQIDCHAIEQCLLGHEMVREVECYKSPFGHVCVDVTQRIPMLSVVTNDGCYYVDSDRRVMPVRKQIDVDVPVFRGAVSQRAATEEYFDFVSWLCDNRYWKSRIHDIHVSNPKSLVLKQEGHDAKILLGALDGYADKLNKLQKLYTKGFDEIGYPECREYDLRFEGQVISRK
jgi:cell division protein FtsQ